MTHRILRIVLAAILMLFVAEWTASATDEEWSEEDEWNAEKTGQKEEEWKENHKADPYGDQPNHQRERRHDGRDELLRVPGGTADERAREALESDPTLPPVPWVDTGPETNIDAQIEAIDELLPPPAPAIVEGGEASMPGGEEVMSGAFTDSDGTGWNYCSGRCTRRTETIARAGGGSDKVIRVYKGTCTCSCVLFDNTGSQLAKKLEVDPDEDDDYLNIGTGNPNNYSLRCCEED